MPFSLSAEDWQAIALTLKLSCIVTLILLMLCTPLALWLSHNKSRLAVLVQTLSALPLVLPPTVLGFYCLLLLSPTGIIGQYSHYFDLHSFAFSFAGIVFASCLYSLPFVLQPLINTFSLLNQRTLETASTLQASPFDVFISIILPQSKLGFISAAILGFAHTMGEFGVILMVGGNIKGDTRVASLQIYEHVESLNFAQAHGVSFVLLVLSFVVLFCMYSLGHKQSVFHP